MMIIEWMEDVRGKEQNFGLWWDQDIIILYRCLQIDMAKIL